MMVGLGTKPKQCGLFTGTQMTNYVYKVTRYNSRKVKCPYFESRGCWADSNPWLKPDKRTMTVYRMNERDPYAGKLYVQCFLQEIGTFKRVGTFKKCSIFFEHWIFLNKLSNR